MQQLTNLLTYFIGTYGLLAVFLLMTFESVLIPIPSEITMTFAGFMAALGVFNFWWVVILGAVGNLTGSLIAFWLGKKMGEKWLRKTIKKYGKWIFIHEDDFDTATKWFKKYGQGISFGSRLLPVVRTYISLPAGISGMNVYMFSIYTLLGSLIWSFVLAYLGLKLGNNWQAIDPFFRKFQYIIITLCLVSVGVFVYLKTNKKAKN